MKNSGFEITEAVMGTRKYKIELIFFIILLVIFCACKTKSNITESIFLENNNLIIKLNNKIPKRRIGKVDDLHLNGCVNMELKVQQSDETVTIISDITNIMDCFYDNEECLFKISWPGGRLLITTLYKEGRFIISKENYINGV